MPTTINVPTDQATLQAALDAAGDGDTIEITAGTYPLGAGTVAELTATQNGKTITVVGLGAGAVFTSTGIGVYANTVSAADETCVVSFENVTFQTSSASGVVRVKAEPKLTFTNCTLGGGIAVDAPIAVYDTASAGTARELTFTNCTLTTGGMVYSGDDAAKVEITGCTIDIGALNSSGHLFKTGAAARVDTLIVSGNTVTIRAANTQPIVNASNLTVCGLIVVKDNTITTSGNSSGVYITGYATTVVVTGNTITFNAANATGAGIQLGTDTANNANPLGKAVCNDNTVTYADADTAHGILIGPGAAGAEVLRNEVYGAYIGIVMKGDYTLTNKIASCAKVEGNKVYGGRGIYLKGSSKNLVRGNTVKLSGSGTGACLEYETETRTDAYASTDNMVVENIFDAGGAGGYCIRDNTAAGTNIRNLYDYNVLNAGDDGVWRVGATEYATLAAAVAALWTDDLTADNDDNSISGDPLLVDPSNADFTIPANSPAFGAGPGNISIGAFQPNPTLKYGSTGVYGFHGA